VKICQLPVRNSRLVRSSSVLKKQDSFRKLASVVGDQLLLQFVCFAVMVAPFSRQSTCKIPCLSQRTDSNTLRYDFCVLNFFEHEELLCFHSLDCSLVSGSYIRIHVSSIVTARFRNPTGSHRNQSKMACEASTRSRF
jgi:hypothetical protein